jgi:hypothetical protein
VQRLEEGTLWVDASILLAALRVYAPPAYTPLERVKRKERQFAMVAEFGEAMGLDLMASVGTELYEAFSQILLLPTILAWVIAKLLEDDEEDLVFC